MPTYVAQCSSCGQKQDFIRKVDDRDNTPDCCGVQTSRIGAWGVAVAISAMSFTGHKGFHMPDGKGQNGEGTWIESGAAYKRYLKDNDRIPASEAFREAEIQAGNRKAESLKQLDTAIESALVTHGVTS